MSKQLLKQLSRFAMLNFLFVILLSQLLPVNKPIPKVMRVNQNQSASSSSSVSSTSSVSSPTDLLSQLPQHNKTSDCWIAVSGHLYDITSFFGSHPGGDVLLAKHCGTDATTAYDTKDADSGRAHSEGAKAMLMLYLIQ